MACSGVGQAPREAPIDGLPVVVVFWSSWCRGCQTNLVALERVGRHLDASGGGRLRLVGVNLDESEEEMARVVSRLGLRVQQMSDPEGELAAQWEVTSLPQVLVIQGGQLLFRGEGTALDWARLWRSWVW